MENKKKTKTENGKILKRVLIYIKKYRWLVALSIFFAAVTVASTLYIPILTGNAVDLVVGPGEVNFKKLGQMLIQMGIVIGITALCQWLMNIINNYVVYHVVKDIRTKAFNQITMLPLSYVDSHPYGDTISRVISDIDTFSDGLLMGFTQLFTGVLTILGTLGFMLSVNYKITIVVVCITPLSFFIAGTIAKRTYTMFRKQSVARGDMTSLVDEMLNNQKVVKAFGHEKESEKNFDELNLTLKEYSTKAIFYSSITNPATRFVNNLVYMCVGVVGAIAAVQGLLSVGQLTAFLSYANQYTKPFNEISGVVTELQNAMASASRVFELIDEDASKETDTTSKTLEHVKGKIDISHVNFSYVKGQQIIEDFNLHIEPGQRVAIVGPTGCGKSTIINLLMRFYDVDSGSICVDGQDIREVTRKSLRKNYGMVLQETWLKTATVAENIAYGRENVSREEIIQAAKQAHAHGFIMQMKNGYDTIIGEETGNLSGGQKQLLCIARVMLELPPMLILDEATSSIDTRTELLVQDAFAKMMKGRTSFIVAHRLSTIREADVILVMKDGHILEMGNHESLMKKDGFYAKLYNSQFAV